MCLYLCGLEQGFTAYDFFVFEDYSVDFRASSCLSFL